MSGQAGRKRVLAAALALAILDNPAEAQPPETRHLSTANCATEGGEIVVRRDGATITYWKGSFCGSTGCATYEVSDLSADGKASVTVNSQYLDGDEIRYQTKADRAGPVWQHNAMISMDYGTQIARDIRLIGELLTLTEAALATANSTVSCNPAKSNQG